MTADERTEIGEYSAKPGVNDEDVQTELQAIWEALRTHPDLDDLAKEVGIAPDAIKGQQLTPFRATRPEAQFGVAETILISVAGGVLTPAVQSGFDKLWLRIIWPQLEKRFGADLEPKKDASS